MYHCLPLLSSDGSNSKPRKKRPNSSHKPEFFHGDPFKPDYIYDMLLKIRSTLSYKVHLPSPALIVWRMLILSVHDIRAIIGLESSGFPGTLCVAPDVLFCTHLRKSQVVVLPASDCLSASSENLRMITCFFVSCFRLFICFQRKPSNDNMFFRVVLPIVYLLPAKTFE